MKVVVYGQCDNPKCRTTKQVESPDTWLEEVELKTVKKVNPPYAWIIAHVAVFGPGPSVNVTVCSLECLPEAVSAALEKEA